MSPSEPGTLEWLRLLVAAGRLYDELAKAGIVDRVTHPGQPKRKGLLPGFAVYWKDHNRTLLEIGAMIDVLTDRVRLTGKGGFPEDGLAESEEVVAKVKQAKLDPTESEKRRLKKLALNYIEVGRKYQQESGEEWPPPPLDGRRCVPPKELRKHFQQMIVRAAARWVASEARPSCRTSSPNHAELVEILNPGSIMGSAGAWFLQPD